MMKSRGRELADQEGDQKQNSWDSRHVDADQRY